MNLKLSGGTGSGALSALARGAGRSLSGFFGESCLGGGGTQGTAAGMRRRHSCNPAPLSSTRAREHCCDGGCAGCGGEPAARGVGGGFLSRHLIGSFDGGIERGVHFLVGGDGDEAIP